MTTYTTVIDSLKRVEADIIEFYGDFGFDYIVEWDGNRVSDIVVNWPAVNQTYLSDAYKFAEALQAFCFEINGIIGTVVDSDEDED